MSTLMRRLNLADDPRWEDEAICAQTDPEAFFPEKGKSTKDAKRVCGGCPVRAECLDEALTHGHTHGVWGGVTEQDRRRMNSLERKRAATAARLAADVRLAAAFAADEAERERQERPQEPDDVLRTA